MAVDEANVWAKTQTIASLIALSAIVLAVIALVNERIQRARSRDVGSIAADSSKMGYFYVPRLSHWSAFTGSKTETLIVTSIRGLIKAGDSGLWTSAALDQLPATTLEICWVSLYENIFDQAVRHPSVGDREAFPKNIKTFLDRADDRRRKEAQLFMSAKSQLEREEERLRREEANEKKDPAKIEKMRKKIAMHKLGAVVDRHDYYGPSCVDLVNCCRELTLTEQRPVEHCDDEGLGLQDIRPTWLVANKPSIMVSREELAALALILGMRLHWHPYAPSLVGIGAFGTSLRVVQENGAWRLHLMQATRIPRHGRSPGSGYTTVMAKHIACGSLPFADASMWVRSVFVTEKVLAGIRTGGSIKDVRCFGGRALEYLRRLPAAKQIDAFYAIDSTPRDDSSLGIILKSDGSALSPKCTWPRAVTSIAFGGLVPQAAENLAQAVSFTVGGTQGGCFEALESLINVLHRHSATKGVFGEYVSQRIDAEDSVDNVNYTLPERGSDARDAAAVFGRYMTLLERLTARCEVSEDRPVDAVFEAACTLIQRLYVSAVRQDEMSRAEREADLGLAVNAVTKRIRQDQAVSLEDCAVVVRAVIAAWAWQVPCIIWPEEGDGAGSSGSRSSSSSNEGSRSDHATNVSVPTPTTMRTRNSTTTTTTMALTEPDPSTRQLVSLDYIPPVSALA